MEMLQTENVYLGLGSSFNAYKLIYLSTCPAKNQAGGWYIIVIDFSDFACYLHLFKKKAEKWRQTLQRSLLPWQRQFENLAIFSLFLFWKLSKFGNIIMVVSGVLCIIGRCKVYYDL